MNVYNCTRPGNLFVGYEQLRSEIAEDVISGKSFAVLGGRRCGKTSLLLQLQSDLQQQAEGNDSRGKILVPFIDLQSLGQMTPGLLFKCIYESTTRGITVAAWPGCGPGEEYEIFLSRIEAAEPVLSKEYGPDWVAILLVDELDAAVGRLPDDQFFQNIRNLLMVSRFNNRFRLIASGVKEMAQLISSGSSPLNNLCHVYLRVLTPIEARSLVHQGFPNNGDASVLFTLTGRHPYLLQGVMEKLPRGTTFDSATLNRAAAEWLREHKDFRRWYDGFTPVERRVYMVLAKQPATHPGRTALLRQLAVAGGELDDALTVLSYHGLIDDTDPDRPQLTGTMFRDWFLQNHREAGTLLGSWLADPGSAESPVEFPEQHAKESPRRSRFPIIPDHDLIGESPIGSGSYGTVWLGKTLIGTYRAIKIVYRSNFEDHQPFERELNGIKAYEPVSRMHPGLVQILQVGSNAADGYFYYVMEAGDDERSGTKIDPSVYSPKNLAQLLRDKGRMSLLECVELSRALASALDYLHGHGLVHRDIKPSNIIFVKGTPKLADIGLVTKIRIEAAGGTWIGTQGYIPPEGPGTAIADIYSLGKVMYEAATGLDRERFPELPAAEFPPDELELFRRFNEVIIRACNSDPRERFQSAGELHQTLTNLSKSKEGKKSGFWRWLRPSD